jgi:hypothetical protein
MSAFQVLGYYLFSWLRATVLGYGIRLNTTAYYAQMKIEDVELSCLVPRIGEDSDRGYQILW